MKKAVSFVLLLYFLFVTFCLPMGDFTCMKDLPGMYRHCKTTEDKDLTPFDFITDHLINIDCLFDKHDNGDTQKPHTPFQYHHLVQQVIFNVSQVLVKWSAPVLTTENEIVFCTIFYNPDFISGIFRPPIV